MKLKILFALSSLIFPSSWAFANSSLTAVYARTLMGTQAALHSSGYLGSHSSSCKKSIAQASADGQLRILVAFGYMDVSADPDYYDSADSLVRLGDVLDGSARQALISALTAKCLSRRSKACEFKNRGGVLTKRIQDRFTNKTVQVSIELVSSSVSSSDQANKSTYSAKQTKQSSHARGRFLSAVQTHDAVLYLGHARSGGGPDFSPPRLLSASRVDYGHYKSTQEGIRSLVGALGGGRPAILGVLACRSTPLFGSRLAGAMGGGTLLTADELFDYNDMLPTALATIEATVGQSCGNEFATISGWPAGRGMLTVR